MTLRKLASAVLALTLFMTACDGDSIGGEPDTTKEPGKPSTEQTEEVTTDAASTTTDRETEDEPSEDQTESAQTTDEDTPTTENTPDDSEPVAFEIPDLPKGDGSTIIVWNQIFEEWNQAFFEERADEYNTLDRGYTVEQEFIPGDAWTERMVAAQSIGSAPDTYILAYNNIYSAVRDASILPLDDIFTKAQLDDIADNVREMVTYNGKIYAYPQLVEPSTVLFYRTDLFEDAGLTEPPKTWDELVEYGVKLTQGDVFGLGISGFAEMGWTTWGWQMQSAGHLALNDNWDAPLIDDGYKELANFWKRLYDEGAVPAEPLSGYTELSAYGQGALAMQLSGSWGIAQLINEYPDIYEVTNVAVPPTKDGNTEDIVATNGGWTYVIDANTKHQDGAYNYISWLLAEDPKTVADFFDVAQYSKAAPRKSVQAYINDLGGTPDHAEIIIGISERAINEPSYPWDISVAVANMFENVAIGGMDVDSAANEATTQIQEIIEQQNLPGQNPKSN